MMSRIFSPQGRVASVLLLFALAGAVYVLLMDTGERSSELVITTKAQALLYPHEHDVGDSINNPNHHVEKFSDVFFAPEDFWITGFSVQVNNAPPVVLHHAILMRADEPNDICPAYGRKEIFVAASDTVLNKAELPDGYGVFVPMGAPLVLAGMFHNPLPPFGPGETWSDVSVSFRMRILPAKKHSLSSVEFHRLRLDEAACDESAQGTFSVPPFAEGYVVKGVEKDGLNPSEFVFEEPGTIIGMGSHIHAWEGGERLDIFLNDELADSFIPYKTSLESWAWASPRRIPIAVRVNEGDTLSIQAVYSNPYDAYVRGAMGMLGFFYAKDGQ